MAIIGFGGETCEMSYNQSLVVAYLLRPHDDVHVGNTSRSARQVASLALHIGCYVTIHPSIGHPVERSSFSSSVRVKTPAKHPLICNREIVEYSDFLIFTPLAIVSDDGWSSTTEMIDHARRKRIDYVIINAEGDLASRRSLAITLEDRDPSREGRIRDVRRKALSRGAYDIEKRIRDLTTE